MYSHHNAFLTLFFCTLKPLFYKTKWETFHTAHWIPPKIPQMHQNPPTFLAILTQTLYNFNKNYLHTHFSSYSTETFKNMGLTWNLTFLQWNWKQKKIVWLGRSQIKKKSAGNRTVRFPSCGSLGGRWCHEHSSWPSCWCHCRFGRNCGAASLGKKMCGLLLSSFPCQVYPLEVLNFLTRALQSQKSNLLVSPNLIATEGSTLTSNDRTSEFTPSRYLCSLLGSNIGDSVFQMSC